jgi:hypothetical protein
MTTMTNNNNRYQVAQDGCNVYDSHSDSWMRFDSPDDTVQWLGAQRENTINDVIVEDRGADDYSAYNIPLGITTANSAPILLLDKDVRRSEARVGYIGSGTLIVGRKEQVQQQQGFVIPPGATVPFDTSAPLWALATPSTTAAIISVLGLLITDVA